MKMTEVINNEDGTTTEKVVYRSKHDVRDTIITYAIVWGFMIGSVALWVFGGIYAESTRQIQLSTFFGSVRPMTGLGMVVSILSCIPVTISALFLIMTLFSIKRG